MIDRPDQRADASRSSSSVRCNPPIVPEGHRGRLAGGKTAPADAAPGRPAEIVRCPCGASKKPALNLQLLPRIPQFTHREAAPCDSAHGESYPDAAPLGKVLRCPAGAWPFRRVNRGLRPLTRACPRLISGGVPPGRGRCQRGMICQRPTADFGLR